MKSAKAWMSNVFVMIAPFVVLFSLSSTVFAQTYVPAEDPPSEHLGSVSSKKLAKKALAAVQKEWTYHKSDDGSHPSGVEQEFLWLTNRARNKPTAEGVWLADTGESSIDHACDWFNVDRDMLKAEFAAIAAKPPAAFDVRLYRAAKEHSEYLIATDAQNHNDQFNRIKDEGFKYNQARGNVYSYSLSAVYGHAGFNVDWGYGSGGMQDPRGHRKAIMSTDGDYTNVGIASVEEYDYSTQVGPQVVTQNFCRANTYYADHHNVFLVGTVWEDANGNQRFDAGEGYGGVTVRPDRGSYYAVTGDAGGFAVPVDVTGSVTFAFTGSSIAGVVSKTVAFSGESVLLDVSPTQAVPYSETPVNTDACLQGALQLLIGN